MLGKIMLVVDIYFKIPFLKHLNSAYFSSFKKNLVA